MQLYSYSYIIGFKLYIRIATDSKLHVVYARDGNSQFNPPKLITMHALCGRHEKTGLI